MMMMICIYVCLVGKFLSDRCQDELCNQNLFLLTLKVQLVEEGGLTN